MRTVKNLYTPLTYWENRYLIRAIPVFLGLAVITASSVAQDTVTRKVFTQYKAKGLSMWPGGQREDIFLSPILVGPTWNAVGEVGGISDLVIPEIPFGLFTTPEQNLGSIGAKVKVSTSGEMGLQIKPWYNGGTVDVDYQGGVVLSFPRFPAVGETVTVKAAFTTNGGSSFKTTTPDFGASFAAAVKVNGKASSEAKFLGETLWNTKVFDDFSVGGEPKSLSNQNFKFSIPGNINTMLSMFNPTPFGALVDKPDVSAIGSMPDAKGVIKKASFGKFLTVETDLLAWISKLFGVGGNALKPFNGNVTLPGTDFNVTWDLVKAFMNMDVGFFSTYTLTPKHMIVLKVYNANNQLIASGPSPRTFPMPEGGVKIVPTLTVDFEFHNQLGLGAGGAIGLTPIKVTAKGSIGSGEHGKNVDFNFDPATTQWQPDPKGSSSLVDAKFQLDWDPEDRTRELTPIGINTASLLELPRELLTGADASPIAHLVAYDVDQGSEFKKINLQPEQGRTFLVTPSTQLKAKIQRAESTETYNINNAKFNNTDLELLIPKSALKPGHWFLTITENTTNSQGQPRNATWIVPVTVNHKKPVVNSQLNTSEDLGVTTVTNRIVDKGRDQWVYVAAEGIYKDTIVYLDSPTGQVKLESDVVADQDITGKMHMGIKIPAYLVSQLAGKAYTFQVQNQNLKVDANGQGLPPLVSNIQPLFFVANKPQVSDTFIQVANQPILFGNEDVWFDLRGDNFCENTDVYLHSSTLALTKLEATYATPAMMRVRLPKSLIMDCHNKGVKVANLFAQTDPVNIPATGGYPAVQSGGESNTIKLSFAYPKPSVDQIDSSILIRGIASKIRIYGQGIYKPRTVSTDPSSLFFLGNHQISASNVTYAPTLGATVPYVDIAISALPDAGILGFMIKNPTSQSAPYQISNRNGLPTVQAGQVFNVKVGPGRSTEFLVRGGPLYPESEVVVNGTSVDADVQSISTVLVSLNESALNALNAPEIKGYIENPSPGGGHSKYFILKVIERDASKFAILKGAATSPGRSGTLDQEYTISYRGKRTVDTTTVRMIFASLPAGVTLLNSNGTSGGSPFLKVQLNNSRELKFTAKFKGARPGFVAPIPTLVFLD